MSAATRVMIFGTHPKQFNGYSKVVYELIKVFANRTDKYDVSVYGFQNFYQNPTHRTDVPSNIYIYDAHANENPKGIGFGIEQVKDIVRLRKPDVCIVYNDMLVVSQIITQLRQILAENHSDLPPFKIIGYVDQVYGNQKPEFIDFINKNVDVCMAFTPKWEECIKDQGVTVPTCYLRHGINPLQFYPIPKHLARLYYGLRADDFIVLNLNRNQPRKRWDTCLKAWAEVVARKPDSNIKLMIATAVTGGWNLLEIYKRELGKRNLTLEEGMKHIIMLDNPQKINDEETNILYNVADVGLNTCDGEGFGLCNFEQAAIGIPQVVPCLGGFEDFFDEECAQLIDPKMAYYVDATRDAVCGEALLCDYEDFTDAILAYYDNRELLASHGRRAREKILRDYHWNKITDELCTIIDHTVGKDTSAAADVVTTTKQVTVPVTPAAPSTPVIEEKEKIDISALVDLIDADKDASKKMEKARMMAEEIEKLARDERNAKKRAEIEEKIRVAKAEQEAKEEARIKADVEARIKAETEKAAQAAQAAQAAAEKVKIEQAKQAKAKAEAEARARAKVAEEESKVRARMRAETEAKQQAAKAQAEKAKTEAEIEARIRAEIEAKMKAESEVKARADAEALAAASKKDDVKAELSALKAKLEALMSAL